MQQGFAMLEVGSCAKDHTKEILLKNIMDIAIGAASWWIVGHAIANGDDSFRNSGANGVFGTSGFGYINAATVGSRASAARRNGSSGCPSRRRPRRSSRARSPSGAT